MKNKTNAMRRLDAAKIPYEVFEYVVDENDLSGGHIADEIGLAHEIVFKTLVAKGDKTGPVVFCMPVDLEKITVSAGVRGAQLLLKVVDLLSFVGGKIADLSQ